MADNINLIPAAELPITEAKEVDVLCVENGELKRKAGANLGGGGGYVLKLTNFADEEIVPNEDGSINLVENISYDEIATILSAGGSAWIDFSDIFAAMGMTGLALAGAVMSWGFTAQLGNVFYVRSAVTTLGEGMESLVFNVIFPNGTWRPEAEA